MRATARARAAAASLALAWRTSLRFRVVGTTLLASAVVVLLLASLLLDQVGRGLVDAKLRASLAEARSGSLQLSLALQDLQGVDQLAVEQALRAQTQALIDRGATGGLYDVVLVGTPGTSSYASPGRGPDDVPVELLEALRSGPSPAYVFEEGVLAVGTLVSAPLATYSVVHLFPLTSEQETFALVQRTAAAAGVLLVGLLALVALLVAQQVVSPVREAARTAQRLAAGRLEERMRVTGEDELATLGESFNSMATALQHQIVRLEELSALQRRFVSDVSHELRTPLTTVRMAADVLHEGRAGFPPAVARSAELLQAELDRFEELLVDLLEISRYDAGAAALDAEPADLVALARRALDDAAPLAERRGSALRLHAEGPVVAEVDAVRVSRVLRNLVVNAVEHGEGRPVEVEVAAAGGTCAVVVRDAGVGLRPEDAELVFTRFWRADPSRARTTGGTGLGLAIAREDARLHGGDLQAWGEPGRGAAFRLVLPARAGGPLGEPPLPLERAAAVGA